MQPPAHADGLRDQLRSVPITTWLQNRVDRLSGTCHEHCPSFHTDSTHLAVLAAQRVDAHDLADDAEKRGWIEEAERHRALVSRLDVLIAESEAG